MAAIYGTHVRNSNVPSIPKISPDQLPAKYGGTWKRESIPVDLDSTYVNSPVRPVKFTY